MRTWVLVRAAVTALLIVALPSPAMAASSVVGDDRDEVIYDLHAPIPQVGALFGQTLSGAPDIDGDGIGELLVGAPYEDVAGISNAGRVYVFSGRTGALLLTLQSPSPSPPWSSDDGNFGDALAGVPDVDGDGSGDILVGAPHDRDGASGREDGRAYLFSGADGAMLHTFAPQEEVFQHKLFGQNVAVVPSLTTRHSLDLVISSQGEFVEGGSEGAWGRVYVFNAQTQRLRTTWTDPRSDSSGWSTQGFGSYMAAIRWPAHQMNIAITTSVVYEPDAPAGGDGRVVIINGRTGKIVKSVSPRNPINSGSFGNGLSVIDDGDGPPSMVFLHYETSAFTYYGYTGKNLHLRYGIDGDSPTDLIQTLADRFPDITGDGKPEFTLAVQSYGDPLPIYDGSTGAYLRGVEPPPSAPGGLGYYEAIEIGDVNNDAVPDLIAATYHAVDDGQFYSSAGQVYVISGATVR